MCLKNLNVFLIDMVEIMFNRCIYILFDLILDNKCHQIQQIKYFILIVQSVYFYILELHGF